MVVSYNFFYLLGLPPSGSWQDLKDHMREAGDVGYADVFRDGTGVVEYLKYEDMKYALRKLDDTKFKSHEVCRCLLLCLSISIMKFEKSYFVYSGRDCIHPSKGRI